MNGKSSRAVRCFARFLEDRQQRYEVTSLHLDTISLPGALLVLLPDRLLVFENREVAGIDYRNPTLQGSQTQFIEDKAPPRDARIVGTTWRFVNKSGGPDRRFASNPQLPIALYEEIHLQSTSGLNELFQCSRLEVGEAVREAVEGIAKIANEQKATRRGQPRGRGRGPTCAARGMFNLPKEFWDEGVGGSLTYYDVESCGWESRPKESVDQYTP